MCCFLQYSFNQSQYLLDICKIISAYYLYKLYSLIQKKASFAKWKLAFIICYINLSQTNVYIENYRISIVFFITVSRHPQI